MDDQPAGNSSQPENTNVPQPPLTYEETPVIEPVPQEPPEEVPSPPESRPTPHNSIGSTMGMIVLFLALFGVGMGLSIFLRQYLSSRSESSPATESIEPSPTISATPSIAINTLSPTATPTATLAPASDVWKTYPVISGATKQPILGVTFMLSSDVLAPVCDGGNCASQGTYLPGGSRFTVAPRGRGQLLIDARGNVGLTDASGKSFTIKQVFLAGGRKALEYSGNFQGSTVGGYTFSSMHGFMIEIDDGLTLEMNHFAPAGLTVDFAGDEEAFSKIVASVEKKVPSAATLTPSPTRVATPTGTLQPTP